MAPMAEEAFQAFVREQRAQRPPGAEEPDWEEEWDDLTLAQKELRKREPKKYTGGDGSEIEEEEEEEVKPARKRGRPSKAGITGSASKAFLKHKAPALEHESARQEKLRREAMDRREVKGWLDQLIQSLERVEQQAQMTHLQRQQQAQQEAQQRAMQ